MIRFAGRFALTDEEQAELVVEQHEVKNLLTSKFLLVGKLLTRKPFNKEAFKRTLVSLWRPKAQVQIIDMEENRFVFSFQTKGARDTILRGGPWTFNHSLLIMAAADGLLDPLTLPLRYQEFWVQVKGLPLVFMTRAMGKLIGDTLGNYVVADQSRRSDCFGSFLRIRVLMDVSRPLRRWLAVRLPDASGTVEWVQIRYEKLPTTCYLCGMLDHGEKECGLYTGGERDDTDKPYGLWFQQDVLGPDYRKPKGRRFGLSSSGGWSLRAPMEVEDGEVDVNVEPAHENRRADVADVHAMNACDPSSGIDGVDGVTEEETRLEATLPDLNGPPDYGAVLEKHVADLESSNGSQNLALSAQDNHGTVVIGTQLTLGPLSMESNMEGQTLRDPVVVPYSGPKYVDMVHEDPFNLSPIIRRITAQDRADGGKRPSKLKKRGRQAGPRRSGMANSNGKRSLNLVSQLEGMHVGKRHCLSSAPSRSMMGSAEVGEVQSRRAP
ncbi:unnamed protein product [Prunus brigantina]